MPLKPHDILPGHSYVGKSGRTERYVVDVGKDVEVRWLGNGEPPPDLVGVAFYNTRQGKTVYLPPYTRHTLPVQSFARWAHRRLLKDGGTFEQAVKKYEK